MKRFWYRHRYALRIIAYVVLIIGAFQLGRAWVSQSMNDLLISVVFVLIFLYIKFYDKMIL